MKNVEEEHLLIAHLVERKRSTGLGDTTALSAGGVEKEVESWISLQWKKID